MQHLSYLVLEPDTIQISKKKNIHKQVVFERVCFHLNKETIGKIKQAQQTGSRLYISRALLADLRNYALFDSQGCLQFEFAFVTYYQQTNLEAAAIRSLIFQDGNIIHQICRDYLENSDLALTIASVHYWLIEQLLRQLYFKAQPNWWEWLSWGLSLLIVSASVLGNLEQWKQMNPPLMFMAPLLMLWLLQKGIKHLLRLWLPHLRRWILHQLLFGKISQKPSIRKLMFRILG